MNTSQNITLNPDLDQTQSARPSFSNSSLNNIYTQFQAASQPAQLSTSPVAGLTDFGSNFGGFGLDGMNRNIMSGDFNSMNMNPMTLNPLGMNSMNLGIGNPNLSMGLNGMTNLGNMETGIANLGLNQMNMNQLNMNPNMNMGFDPNQAPGVNPDGSAQELLSAMNGLSLGIDAISKLSQFIQLGIQSIQTGIASIGTFFQQLTSLQFEFSSIIRGITSIPRLSFGYELFFKLLLSCAFTRKN